MLSVTQLNVCTYVFTHVTQDCPEAKDICPRMETKPRDAVGVS